MRASQIAQIIGGELKGSDTEVEGFCINSKEIRQGQVFVAIKGQRHDGHDYVGEAFERGAVGALVERDVEPPEGKLTIRVESTLEGLRRLALWKREGFKGKVIGIAGSAGKTTTKEMVAFLLSKVGKVCKTPKNFNSQITVPLSLCNFSLDADFWVVEMGASQKGDVKRLVEVVKPHVRVITAIGEEHLETFGCLDDVVAGNGEILSDMGPSDVGIYPSYVSHCYSCERHITFGEGSSLHAEDVRLDWDGVRFRVDTVEVFIPVPSLAVVENALCSFAVLKALGIDWRELSKELGNFQPVEGRFKVIRGKHLTIIDDAYNANPPSVRKALQTLSRFKGQRIAVLGDMLELGKDSELYHREVGSICARLGIDYAVFYGKQMIEAYRECLSLGGRCAHFEDKEELLFFLKALLSEGVDKVVLFKGSRGMRMEELVQYLTEEFKYIRIF